MEVFTIKYLSAYALDLLYISHEPSFYIDKIDHYFKIKDNSRGISKAYLGGQINAVTLSNNIHAWSFTSSKCVQDSLQNIHSLPAHPDTDRI